MEKEFGEYPIQNIIGDKEAYKKMKKSYGFNDIVYSGIMVDNNKKYWIKKDTHLLKWVAF